MFIWEMIQGYRSEGVGDSEREKEGNPVKDDGWAAMSVGSCSVLLRTLWGTRQQCRQLSSWRTGLELVPTSPIGSHLHWWKVASGMCSCVSKASFWGIRESLRQIHGATAWCVLDKQRWVCMDHPWRRPTGCEAGNVEWFLQMLSGMQAQSSCSANSCPMKHRL